MARVLVPSNSPIVPIRLINTNEEPVRLEKGESLEELRAVQVCEDHENAIKKSRDDIILDMIGHVDRSVDNDNKEKLNQLLTSYQYIHSASDYDLGGAIGVLHSIDTGNTKPLKQALRRQLINHQEAIDDQVKEMLEQKVIQPSRSAWSSNVVLVKKKDGKLRFCIDYRRLNEATVKNAYPLPRISACLDALGGAKYFSTFDLRSGYFQVYMDPTDADKTTFITSGGLYEFAKMPFGLCNAPGTFRG